MKISNSIEQSEDVDKFCFVEISDLEASAVGGGALVGVVATAYASGGDLTVAWTDVTTTAKMLASGGSIAKGKGIAIAIGDYQFAYVAVYGEGDKVIERIKTHYFPKKNMTVTKGFVIAIDYP